MIDNLIIFFSDNFVVFIFFIGVFFLEKKYSTREIYSNTLEPCCVGGFNREKWLAFFRI